MVARATPLDDSLRAALLPLDAVRVAYFFGSRAEGGARPDSDVDIAVAFTPGASARAREDARRAIVGLVTDALGALGERADVVDLDAADSAVSFRAIKDGRLLFARTAEERVRAEVRVGRRYDDDAPKRALFREAARAAAARLGV
jgi:uncharacterized protein